MFFGLLYNQGGYLPAPHVGYIDGCPTALHGSTVGEVQLCRGDVIIRSLTVARYLKQKIVV
jgi:hypothetical protein